MKGYLFDVIKLEVYPNSNAYAKHSNHCVVIKNKLNLNERYGITGLLEFIEKLHTKYKKSVTIEDTWTVDHLADAVWKLFEEVCGEQINAERRRKRAKYYEGCDQPRKRGNPTSNPRRVRRERNYRWYLDEVEQENNANGRSTLPPQARTIVAGIARCGRDLFTESEMMEFMEALSKDGFLVGKGGLPVQQSTWRIFSYYEMLMEQKGLMVREYI